MRTITAGCYGRRLKAIRIDRGLTQAALAEAIGKTRPAFGHWEAGRAFIRSRDLVRAARALNVRIRDLLTPPDAPILWPWRPSKRRARKTGPIVPACTVPVSWKAGPMVPACPSAEAAELERLKALLVEVLQRLVRYEPEATDLLDQISAPPTVSVVRRAA